MLPSTSARPKQWRPQQSNRRTWTRPSQLYRPQQSGKGHRKTPNLAAGGNPTLMAPQKQRVITIGAGGKVRFIVRNVVHVLGNNILNLNPKTIVHETADLNMILTN